MKQTMRTLAPIILMLIGLLNLTGCTPEIKTTTPNVQKQSKDRAFADDPQYEKYEDIIKTPLRGLVVSDDFSLVDDFGAFMAWHDRYTSGRHPEDTGKIQYQRSRGMNITHCVDDIKTLTGTRSLTDGEGEYEGNSRARYKYEHTKVQIECEEVIGQQFLHTPSRGSKQYADILRYWSDNEVLTNINKLTSEIPTHNSARASFSYATWSRVGFSMAHYAIYHRLYGLDLNEHEQIDKMFTVFVENYDYYQAFWSSGPNFQKVCDLTVRATVRPNSTNDHCGSANLRIAVGAVLYGLEFGNQRVFDYGIRRLEIVLATFDKSHAYTAQIYRGMLALGYARQIIKELDKLDYAFEKAFDIDFSEMLTVHGSTPKAVYLELLVFANNPHRLLDYFGKNGYGTDRRGGSIKRTLRDVREGKKEPSAVWEAFNLDDYYLYGGKMAADNFPEEFFKLLHCTARDDAKYVNDASISTGFNNLILRQASGQMLTNPFEQKNKFPLCKSLERVTFPPNRPQVREGTPGSVSDDAQPGNFDFNNRVNAWNSNEVSDSFDGNYRVKWSIRNINTGVWEAVSEDHLTIENGIGAFTSRSGAPGSPQQRRALTVIVDSQGVIRVMGTLGLFDTKISHETLLSGEMADGVFQGIWHDGDGMRGRLTKVE